MFLVKNKSLIFSKKSLLKIFFTTIPPNSQKNPHKKLDIHKLWLTCGYLVEKM